MTLAMVCAASRRRLEEMIGLAQAEPVEKDLVQLVVVVLAGVDENVLHRAVELGMTQESLMISGRVPTIVMTFIAGLCFFKRASVLARLRSVSGGAELALQGIGLRRVAAQLGQHRQDGEVLARGARSGAPPLRDHDLVHLLARPDADGLWSFPSSSR
jgi:hypothetical protein